MTIDQNKRYIRWGIYLFGNSSVWALMQIDLLDRFPSFEYKLFATISIAVGGFSTFFFLLFLGIMPRYSRFLERSDILTDEQLRALKIFPRIEG